ncbi:MAG: response regulator [Gammaproteobacteria bacterium]|nr:response regulator [Gammaproteobacteria bacterium]
MANVLVVDDEVSIRFMLREILEQEGHDIEEAVNGEEALMMINAGHYDLVITDLVMPKKNGIDVIVEFKRADPDCRILAISGGGGTSGHFDYLPVAERMGASGIMSKPFLIADLKDKVNEILAA